MASIVLKTENQTHTSPNDAQPNPEAFMDINTAKPDQNYNNNGWILPCSAGPGSTSTQSVVAVEPIYLSNHDPSFQSDSSLSNNLSTSSKENATTFQANLNSENITVGDGKSDGKIALFAANSIGYLKLFLNFF
jgi:hypothetical protein